MTYSHTLVVVLALAASACQTVPTQQTIRDDLLKVQQDLATVAAISAPLVQGATQVADIVEIASGNAELIPLTNAVSIAVQQANIAVSKQQSISVSPSP